MKKILFILLLTIVCIGCTEIGPYNQLTKAENSMYGYTYLDGYKKYRKVNIDDHEYILFIDGRSSAISVIHSESCSCKKKK